MRPTRMNPVLNRLPNKVLLLASSIAQLLVPLGPMPRHIVKLREFNDHRIERERVEGVFLDLQIENGFEVAASVLVVLLQHLFRRQVV